MKSASLKERLRYMFDNSMSRGTIALIGWLAVGSLLLVVVAGAVIAIFGLAPEGISPSGDGNAKAGFFDIVWFSLMRTLDAGTMGGDSGGWAFLFSILAVTLGGVFIVSTLIGVLTSGIEAKVDELRKGRSKVIERDHTLILGWSPKIFSIISELVEANANRTKPRIVILADKDKVEMEDEVRSRVPDTKNTKVVCRTGNPIDLADLEIVNPHAARSIVVLAPEEANPDSQVIKAILAITNNPNRRKEPYHIVAEIQDEKNLEVAKMVGKDEVELVVTGDLIARIVVQTCRQSGLSVVHTELLDFGGDEIYFQEEPLLVGWPFMAALFAYEDSTIIGLRTADGRVLLNPPMDTRIGPGDKVIAVSEDDDTVRISGRITDWNQYVQQLGIDLAAIREVPKQPAKPERTLILGWNRRGPTIVNELDRYVAAGSAVTIVAAGTEVREDLQARCSGIKNMKGQVVEQDTTVRKVLDSLNVAGFDQIIILSYEGIDVQEADARTLVTLLHLRDISEKLGKHLRIVSEMLDIRNRELAEVTKADDFIVSNRLVSLMLSQISENKELTAVFMDLFDPEGSEVYIKPAENYVELGRPVNFYTVTESARRRNEIALGYRLIAHSSDASKAYGVVTNPEKSPAVVFSPGDKIIVVAED
ncbi:MAG: NAD-binding protein [Deltaproteobacteria bacterium]|nr:NAD-binding protein [Deltaproteobacteria bacterium]